MRLAPPGFRGRGSGVSPRLQPASCPSFAVNMSKLHGLKKRGKLDLRGHWGVAVSGNWRVAFRFEGRDAVDVNYLDYH